MTLIPETPTRRVPRGAVLALGLALAAPALASEQTGTNADTAAAAAPGPVATIDAAVALGDFGLAQEDPSILLGAARALQLVGARAADGEVTGEGTAPEGVKATEAQETGKPEEAADTARSLAEDYLAEARFLARGDEALLARADQIAEAATKGSTTGPGVYSRSVNARSYLDITEAFSGGRVAEVSLVGDGDTDLDLEIIDENGNTICEQTSYSDREYCRWNPAWTGRFTIRVTNYGYVYNNARIHVN
mgnify:CR=1 FL=1